jgi:hypothetical protein
VSDDDIDPECLVCGRAWETVRTFDGTVYVIERHRPGCPLTIDPTLLPEPGPQGDAV